MKAATTKMLWQLLLGAFLGMLLFFCFKWLGGMGYIYEKWLPDKAKIVKLESGMCYRLRNGWATFEPSDQDPAFVWGLVQDPRGGDFSILIDPIYLAMEQGNLEEVFSEGSLTVWYETEMDVFFAEEKSLSLLASHKDKKFLYRLFDGNIKRESDCQYKAIQDEQV